MSLPRGLSTHGLTRRPTRSVACSVCWVCPFNSRPHEEADAQDGILSPTRQSFNSRPHEEADSVLSDSPSSKIPFQLTASRGGRQETASFLPEKLTFNSRPHEEADVVYWCMADEIGDFQLTASRGGRRSLPGTLTPLDAAFNSRPHEEADNIR